MDIYLVILTEDGEYDYVVAAYKDREKAQFHMEEFNMRLAEEGEDDFYKVRSVKLYD